MANKNKIRSIRISDEMLQLIDRQVGYSFTEKWENLVQRCVWELPAREEELRRIQEQIQRERSRLSALRDVVQQVEQLESFAARARTDLVALMSAVKVLELPSSAGAGGSGAEEASV